MIHQIYWPVNESGAVREYLSAGPSPYGQRLALNECMDLTHGHFCYVEAISTEGAMEIASQRHPEWKIPPVWLGKEWWKICPKCRQEIDPDVCGCGTSKKHHGNPMDEGHVFVPAGCDCFRSRQSARRGDTIQSAISLVERGDGQVLVIWNARFGGWVLPGGRVEDAESLEEAQARELLEETGLTTVERVLIHTADSGGAHVHFYRVRAEGVPRQVEDGHPVSWMTWESVLSLSPFKETLRGLFEIVSRRKL